MVLSFAKKQFVISPVHTPSASKVKLMTSLPTMSDDNVSHSVTLYIPNNSLTVLSIVVNCDAKVMKIECVEMVIGPQSLTPKQKQTRCSED